MKKRGQIDSHIFVYFLTVLIVGAVIVIGYKFITKGSSSVNKGSILQLKNGITADITSAGKEFGKFKKVTYILPENLNELCFVDLTKNDELLKSKLIDSYPIIKDNIQSNTGNDIFFFGSSDKLAYDVKNFEINHYPYLQCFKRQDGKITFGLSGLGGGKTMITTDFLTKANLNPKKTVILQSADGIITLEIPLGTTANNNEISIEMVKPPEGAENGASDIYKFEASGTKFSQPIKLKVKFNPGLVGGCPTSLVFNQINKDTLESYVANSKSIDCVNNIATFEIDKFV